MGVSGAALNRQIIVGSIGAISVFLASLSYFFPWFGAALVMFFGFIMAEEASKSYPPMA